MNLKSIVSLCIGTTMAFTEVSAALTRYIDLPPGEYVRVSGLSADGSTLLAINSSGWTWREATGFNKMPDAVYPRHGGRTILGFPAGARRLTSRAG